MKVLVTGAGGFIGSAIAERLLSAGHEVRACARGPGNLPASDRVERRAVDLNEMLTPEAWLPLIEGVDGVVNAAGILRETRRGDFERIHCTAPWALAEACQRSGVRSYVQISALGEPEDGEFVASKHRLDARLAALDGLDAVVLRPSVVVSRRGSYGGTSMLRAMAALPGVLVLPGRGEQRIQPLWLEDLAELVHLALARRELDERVLDVVGPDTLTLHDYLALTRQWLKIAPPKLTVHVPMPLVSLANALGDRLRAGPLGRTMGRMLERGNVSEESAARADRALGFSMGSIRDGLSQSASFVQDRWQARLYPLIPLAWLSLVIIWLLSAASGYLARPQDYAPLLDQMGVPVSMQASLVLATSSINLLLGLALALRRAIVPVLALMLVSVLAYTIGLGVLVPAQWLDLTGGLLKNLGLVLLIAFMLVLEQRR
ncbi:NAD-dependent epimerase/dehydratase family protein [Wenzhouxiangella marina]|uniref:Putative nucleoside-diphosphate-sugar epimerase n=1 Tax=Wenzhouxiangella marina TaxID=1579979 RepID=A0A0K0XUA9_9GAMM|nr:NAD-dependent epimerase/dehydratase family protein [Wenzhouxiangella marina]AKS41250.1 putative nucleoside-diphosphate-sugar epimerase [Wenzhouxiangella marina]MBB6088130.1 uncharacterized protein YbjT (DUF2867 family) [Wenzhouxiangella marina]